MNALRMAALAVAFVAALKAANASPMDHYYSDENPIPRPPAPVDPADPSQGWQWPANTWPHGPGGGDGGVPPAGTVIGPGNFRLFGLENLYQAGFVKFLTLEFDYTGGDPTETPKGGNVPSTFGYHPARNVGGVARNFRVTDDGTHFKMTWRIDPQPDWEWMGIRNDGDAPLVMAHVRFDSECRPVPEPASCVLVAWGAVGSLWRRARG